MGESGFAFLIAVLVGASVLLFFFAAPKLNQEVPSEDREYMDPLPSLLRLTWPLVRFFEYHVCQFIPADSLEKTVAA